MEHRSLPPAEPTDGEPLVHYAEQRVLQPHQQHGVPERPLRLPQPKLRHERKTLQPHPAHQEAEVARDVPHPWSVGHADGQEQPIQEQQSRLVLFPMRDGVPTSHVMGKTPYVEASVGIYNIFKLLYIEYVRRLTYTDILGVKKGGIRFMILMIF